MGLECVSTFWLALRKEISYRISVYPEKEKDAIFIKNVFNISEFKHKSVSVFSQGIYIPMS